MLILNVLTLVINLVCCDILVLTSTHLVWYSSVPAPDAPKQLIKNNYLTTCLQPTFFLAAVNSWLKLWHRCDTRFFSLYFASNSLRILLNLNYAQLLYLSFEISYRFTVQKKNNPFYHFKLVLFQYLWLHLVFFKGDYLGRPEFPVGSILFFFFCLYLLLCPLLLTFFFSKCNCSKLLSHFS